MTRVEIRRLVQFRKLRRATFACGGREQMIEGLTSLVCGGDEAVARAVCERDRLVNRGEKKGPQRNSRVTAPICLAEQMRRLKNISHCRT